MFIGHFGLAFAAKKVAPQVSLGTTILACEFLDVLWPVFVLTGVEEVRIVPEIKGVTPLYFVHYPWSHSLLMAFAWGALFATVYWMMRKKGAKRPREKLANALWLGALVVSHWFLDFVVHRPDLPLYPVRFPRQPELYGLGLWDSLPATLAIEFGLFAAGIYIYLRSTRARDRTGTIAFWALVAVLTASYLGAVFGPPPPSVRVLAYTSLIGYLMVVWGWWIDRHREPVRR
jgi:membrane-bound metal-dependent hydrolase YbcI (DUF457 family)